jgi:hypothetical protein
MDILSHSNQRFFGVAWCNCGCGRFTIAFWRWELIWRFGAGHL